MDVIRKSISQTFLVFLVCLSISVNQKPTTEVDETPWIVGSVDNIKKTYASLLGLAVDYDRRIS